jgi:nucleotide-binding universal stress UspA family protein
MSPSRSIVLTLSGSPNAGQALPYARALAQRGGAHLTLLRVLPVRSVVGTDGTAGAWADLPRLASRLDPEVATQVILTETTVATSICGWVRQAHSDLSAIASHGSRGLTRAVLGSVAAALVQRATLPVLILHPGPPQAFRLPE